MTDDHAVHPEPDTADRQPDGSEPTPGSDGDGAEPGYTPPEELSAHDAPVRRLDQEQPDGS